MAYKKCCRRAHRDGADNPEALMRSRFSAFAMGKVAYVQASQTQASERADVARFCQLTDFVGLEILEVEEGEPGFVTFRAELVQGGRDASFTERSRFERHEGAWMYVAGERL